MASSSAFSSSGRWLATALLAALAFGLPATGTAQQIPGALDEGFNAGVAQVGRGRAVAVQNDGKILVGGTFTSVGGAASEGLARFNTDGSVDTGFQPGLAAAGAVTVRAVVVQGDGKILVGGNFARVGGMARHGVARLNADGSLDGGFDAGLTAAEADVRAILVQGDGKVLIGGYFTSISGVARAGIARLNADGPLEAAYKPDLYESQHPPAVTAMALQSDGKLLIGGDFTGIDGGGHAQFARLNADGSVDYPFYPSVVSFYYDSVAAIIVQKDGNILVGGEMDGANGSTISGLVRFKPDGTTDYSFRPDLPSLGCYGVNAMALQGDGRVLIVSQAFGDVAANHRLLRLNADGTADASYNLPVQTTGDDLDPEALAILPDGTAAYAGSFDLVNGTARDGVARLGASGSLDGGFDPAIELGGTEAVSALLARDDGGVVVGGSFNRVNGSARDGVARVRGDGTLDGGFAPSLASASGGVSVGALATQKGGGLLVGGNFTVVNGVAQHALARFNADGTWDAAFLPSFALQDDVPAVGVLVPLDDGGVLAGGLFDSVNGDSTYNGVVRLKANGKVDAGFAPALDYYGSPIPVHGLAVQPDGKVLIGGEFTSASNAPCDSLVRVNADGTLDRSFLPTFSAPGGSIIIQTLALQPDGKVLVAGNFDSAGGVACDGLVRLNADGTLDTEFVPQLTAAGGGVPQVEALAVQSNGRIIIAGHFDSVNGAARPGLARLKADGTLEKGYAPGLNTTAATVAVLAVALQADGKALVGGNFTQVDGAERAGVARLLPGTPPEVNVSVKTPGIAYEGGGAAKILFTLTGDLSEDVTVFYIVKGEARSGVDFEPLSGSLVVPAGKRRGRLNVKAVDDSVHEGTRHLRIKLLPSPTGAYNVGAATKAKVAIQDNE